MGWLSGTVKTEDLIVLTNRGPVFMRGIYKGTWLWVRLFSPFMISIFSQTLSREPCFHWTWSCSSQWACRSTYTHLNSPRKMHMTTTFIIYSHENMTTVMFSWTQGWSLSTSCKNPAMSRSPSPSLFIPYHSPVLTLWEFIALADAVTQSLCCGVYGSCKMASFNQHTAPDPPF